MLTIFKNPFVAFFEINIDWIRYQSQILWYNNNILRDLDRVINCFFKETTHAQKTQIVMMKGSAKAADSFEAFYQILVSPQDSNTV